MSQTLDRLEQGESASIDTISGADAFRRRLLELGFVSGTKVRALRTAPMGDPMEVEVHGFRLTLRKADAQRIRLKPLGSSAQSDQPTTRETDAPTQLKRISAHSRKPGDTRYRVLLAGNPNSGKTTLFNALTGASAHVDNYPGSTVDQHVGVAKLPDGSTANLLDLPGMYSINAESHDEFIALQQIIGHGQPPPDALVVMINASTLARGLYLLLQLQELEIPVIGVLNMMDEVEHNGLQIDIPRLTKRLGLPLVPMVARSRQGVDLLRQTLCQILTDPTQQKVGWRWRPSEQLNGALDQLAQRDFDFVPSDTSPEAKRALALWCLMSVNNGLSAEMPAQLVEQILTTRKTLFQAGCDVDSEVAHGRYRQIDAALEGVIKRPEISQHHKFSDLIDNVLTHPIWGIAVFVLLMATIFTAIFDWAEPLMAGIETGIASLSGWLMQVLPAGVVAGLIGEGIVQGVGAVLVFLPQIALLFAFLAILQSCGYMARAAFVVDRVMKKVGLHGKAFVPLLAGFACAIPAVMATRTMQRRRDRLLIMMVIPLISCSARLPVYTLIIATLFPANRLIFGPFSLGAAMMCGLYLISTCLALVAASIIGRTVLKAKQPTLLLELPPYRLPTARRIVLTVLQQVTLFIKTAGTVIVAMSILLWILLHYPANTEHLKPYDNAIASAQGNSALVAELKQQRRSARLKRSYAGQLGRFIEPVIEPLGFDWKIGIGLIGSFAAREVFVATMGLVYGTGDADETSPRLREAIRNQRHADGQPVYTPLVGMSLLVFFLIAMQCVSTLAIVKQESHSWKWPIFMTVYLTALAYLASLAVYQTGKLFGFS